MSIIKNEIPILEYDDAKSAVIEPRHENLPFVFPEKCLFAFLGESVYDYAKENNLPIIGEFLSITRTYHVFEAEIGGEKVTLFPAPMGSSAAAQTLDWLIGYGVREILAIGSCGALVDFPENTFMLPTKALRDDGTSYHYIPAERFIELDSDMVDKIAASLTDMGLSFERCTTWTTDGFYRETRDMIDYRKAEGCSVVEMECSAIAACARFRKAKLGMILYTADTLADFDKCDERNWGSDVQKIGVNIGLNVLGKI